MLQERDTKSLIIGGRILFVIAIAIGLLIATCAGPVKAQSFIGGGLEYTFGEFGLYDGPKLAGAHALGGFIEGQAEFKAGQAYLTPRGLVSVRRNFPQGGGEHSTEARFRPEMEFGIQAGEYFRPFVSAGLEYAQAAGGGDASINPLLSAGVQAGSYRIAVIRLLPDSDNGDFRAWIFRGDYTRPGFFSKNYGLRFSAEYGLARSELHYAPAHPGYAGRTITGRVGLIFGK